MQLVTIAPTPAVRSANPGSVLLPLQGSFASEICTIDGPNPPCHHSPDAPSPLGGAGADRNIVDRKMAAFGRRQGVATIEWWRSSARP